MKTHVASSFVVSTKTLEYYYYKGIPDDRKLERLQFSELHEVSKYQPDYLIKNARQSLLGDSCYNLSTQLECALDWLSEPICFRGDSAYVEKERFGEWQETILSVSPLMLVTRKLFKNAAERPLWDIKEAVQQHFKWTSIPSVYEPLIERLALNKTFGDGHMHLNGSTEPDIVWLDALKSPVDFHRYLSASKGSSFSHLVDEQYLQFSRFDQNDVYRLLLIARKLREDLINKAFGDLPNRYSLHHSSKSGTRLDCSLRHADLQDESLFFIQAFRTLNNNPSLDYVHWFHYYILIRSFFHRLLVQQKTQVGFDQFQKITLNELREKKESTYYDRFKQMQGMHTPSLARLEARFAPKDTADKFLGLIRKIGLGYKDDVKDELELTLLPHFIKQPDTRAAKDIKTFRDLQLRLKNKRQLDVMLNLLDSPVFESKLFASKCKQSESMDFRSFGSLRNLIVGFDAAANELHAGPEVFSPIFRKLQYLGYTNFTYHAGEDFVHLLSGCRAVFEAVSFLDMMPGNRIGHGTALGIEPALWLKRVGKRLFIKQGEWLDNLTFAYYLCHKEPEMYYLCPKLETLIQEIFIRIYAMDTFVPVQVMIDAWTLRKFDPFIVFKWRSIGIFDGFATQELKSYESSHAMSRLIFEKYHSASVIERSNEIIEIQADTPFNASELRKLQNILIAQLNKRRISIESLISSNVRISHYKDYDEHHIIRWLGLTNETDPKPTVVLGTDDTGIFMTNIHNEYTHALYCIEAKTDLKRAEEILEKLASDSANALFSPLTRISRFPRCSGGAG